MATSCFGLIIYLSATKRQLQTKPLKRRRNKKGHTVKLKAEAEVIVNKSIIKAFLWRHIHGLRALYKRKYNKCK